MVFDRTVLLKDAAEVEAKRRTRQKSERDIHIYRLAFFSFKSFYSSDAVM